MASLKSIEIDERTIDGAAPGVRRIKISMSDKRQALMDLAKIARMLPADRLEHSGSIEHVRQARSTRSTSRGWRPRSASSYANSC